MRFQSIYVDMRPLLTKWLGFLTALVFLFLVLASMRPDLQRAVEQFVKVYEQQHNAVGQGTGLEFWNACLSSSACWRGIIFSWSAPLLLKSLLIAGTVFGIFSAAYGMWWRPEVMANRDSRVNSARIEESRNTSPVPPSGIL